MIFLADYPLVWNVVNKGFELEIRNTAMIWVGSKLETHTCAPKLMGLGILKLVVVDTPMINASDLAYIERQGGHREKNTLINRKIDW